jgi:hypothetical protein
MIKDFSFVSIKRLPNYQYMDLCEPQLMELEGRCGAIGEGV